jgi:hypothetical protein
LLLSGFPVLALGAPETTARLFKRYEGGGHEFRMAEDILTLSLSIGSHDRKMVAVRVCSQKPLPFALAIAGANPFHIAELLRGGYAYSPEHVLFLRSEDCLPSKDPSRPATEIWAIPEGASLPAHVEAAESDQIRRISLSKRSVNRGARDYRTALQKLVKDLRGHPASVGVVFGYFLERPRPELKHRLREVTKTLKRSRLPPNRYLVLLMNWDDEVSTYPPDSEPQYPSVFVVEVASDSSRR